MKPYNKKAKCPKCGGADIGSGYHEDHFHCTHGCPGWNTGADEHISRHCKNCHYQWLEAPLDAVLPEGMEVQKITISDKDAEFLESSTVEDMT